ncbi:tRNA pseudouridine(13) synthase TruD [Candidatus Thorarchaeota archaeon]|nr:MAG: tRNA pseudouridine(13) synthase TruD [Candidatus Thorarchaeota archaeon]
METPFPIEKTLGIELYSTSWSGLGGSIKNRYADFIVEEITPSGKILEVLNDPNTLPPINEQVPRNPEDSTKHIHFTVQKMGLTTFDVASILASSLGIPRYLVTHAGLKDKRAITSQRMCIPGSQFEKLGALELYDIWLRDPEYSRAQLHIGDLWGNRFKIVLREMDSPCEERLNEINSLRATSLLNYYGVQRFGVVRPFTHLVGKALLKNDFEEAISFMLSTTSDYESEEITALREEIASGNLDESLLEELPSDFRYERKVIEYLMNHPGEYEKAFFRIPSRMQAFFVHAYQSFIFNRLISLRAKRGLSIETPQIGDFIVKQDMTHSGRDQWLYVNERSLDERRKLVKTGEYGLAAHIPGYSTKLPPGKPSKLLRVVLKKEGIRLIDFRNPERKQLDSAGGLRLVSIKVPNLKVECRDESLDLSFSIIKGSYATIIMREIMKNNPINRV